MPVAADRVIDALDAAQIPAERRGAARTARLSPEHCVCSHAMTSSTGAATVGRRSSIPSRRLRRGHAVLIDDEREVQAMCAIDALGIAPMLNLPIDVVSRDPISCGEIRVHVGPDGAAHWAPEGAVVLAGSTRCDGPSFHGCCDVLNFFESSENAERHLVNHPEISGAPISIPEAVEAGRVVFGNVLKGN